MEEILEKMNKEIDRLKTDLMTCVSPLQLDSLAYELVAKEEIVGAIENNLVNIEDYIDMLKAEESPLDRIYKTFMKIVWESNRIIEDFQIYDCLDTIKEDLKNE